MGLRLVVVKLRTIECLYGTLKMSIGCVIAGIRCRIGVLHEAGKGIESLTRFVYKRRSHNIISISILTERLHEQWIYQSMRVWI